MDSNNGSYGEKKKMSTALKLTIIFICVVAALTFYSRTIYNAGLPNVQITGVKSEQLRIVHTGEGFIVPKETLPLYAPGDLVVTDVLVRLYDEVSEGDVLAEFDVSGLENQLKDLNTLINKQRTEWATNWTNTIEMDIDDTDRHIKNLRAQIEKGRELVAPFDCIVTGVYAEQGMMAGRYAPLFELGNTELGFIIKLVLPAEYATFFNTAFIHPMGTSAKLKGTIISRTAAPDGGAEITLEIDPGRSLLKPDMMATIELTHVTERMPALVPVTAVMEGAFVYKLIETESPLGTEYRVRRIPVDIGVQAGGWVAVFGDVRKGDEVVTSSDRPLKDERVKIFREY